jgi:hypothetical protein
VTGLFAGAADYATELLHLLLLERQIAPIDLTQFFGFGAG